MTRLKKWFPIIFLPVLILAVCSPVLADTVTYTLSGTSHLGEPVGFTFVSSGFITGITLDPGDMNLTWTHMPVGVEYLYLYPNGATFGGISYDRIGIQTTTDVFGFHFVSGALSAVGTYYAITDGLPPIFGPSTGTLIVSRDASAVPEPSSLPLLCIGIAGVIGCGWRYGRG